MRCFLGLDDMSSSPLLALFTESSALSQARRLGGYVYSSPMRERAHEHIYA